MALPWSTCAASMGHPIYMSRTPAFYMASTNYNLTCLKDSVMQWHDFTRQMTDDRLAPSSSYASGSMRFGRTPSPGRKWCFALPVSQLKLQRRHKTWRLNGKGYQTWHQVLEPFAAVPTSMLFKSGGCSKCQKFVPCGQVRQLYVRQLHVRSNRASDSIATGILCGDTGHLHFNVWDSSSLASLEVRKQLRWIWRLW